MPPELVFLHENSILGGDSFYLRYLLSSFQSEEYLLVYGGSAKVCEMLSSCGIPSTSRRLLKAFNAPYFIEKVQSSCLPWLLRAVLYRIIRFGRPILDWILRLRLQRLQDDLCLNGPSTLVINSGGFPGPESFRSVYPLLRRKCCFILHNHVPDDVSIEDKYARLLNRIVGQWIVGSPVLLRQLQDRLGVSKSCISYIPYGVEPNPSVVGLDTNEIRTRFGLNPRQFVVIHPSVFEKRKGHEFTLKGFRELIVKFPDARLLISGDGGAFRQEIERSVDVLELRHHVIFTGFYEPLEELLMASDAVCLPSQEFETTPLSLLLALAVGTPIITTDREDFAGILRHGENSLLVPRGDYTAIGAGLIQLAGSSEFRLELGTRGKEAWRSNFSLGRMVDRTKEILCEFRGEEL